MNPLHISIQTQDFDVSAELAALRRGDKRVGAVCSFVGTVRELNAGSQVATAQPVLTLLPNRPLLVRAELNESFAAAVREGMLDWLREHCPDALCADA